jgi:hypothetical protein
MAFQDLMGKLGGSKDIDEDSDEPFDDEDDILEPDPAPARTAVKSDKTSKIQNNITIKIPTTKAAKEKFEQEIRDKVYTMIALPGGMLAMVGDVHCGTAITNQAEAIANAMVPIVLRNDYMLKFFMAGDGNFMDYIGLGMALYPVGKAIVDHHIRHVDQEEELDDYSQYSAPRIA